MRKATPRGVGFLFGLALLCVILPNLSWSDGKRDYTVEQVHLAEGDSIIPFNVECDSNTWTVLAASDTIRRALVVQRGTDNSQGVCISSITTAGIPCSSTTSGVEITTATLSWEDYSENAYRCRSRAANTVLQRLRGFIYRDTEDWPRVGR